MFTCWLPLNWVLAIWFIVSHLFHDPFFSFLKSFPLITVNLVMDKIANRPRGFAFIRYATEVESQKAIEGMHGKVRIRTFLLNYNNFLAIFLLEINRCSAVRTNLFLVAYMWTKFDRLETVSVSWFIFPSQISLSVMRQEVVKKIKNYKTHWLFAFT